MRILLSAYACDPARGSEAGGGWNWAFHLARAGHEVCVLTRSMGRASIEAACRTSPMPNLEIVYVDAAGPPRLLRGLHGSWYWDYLDWQRRALGVARRLHRIAAFDLVQHVSWGSIHAGSRLWKLGIPFVFGPVGGGQVAPSGFWRYFDRGAHIEQLRSWVVRHMSARWLFGRSTVTHADLVFVTNRETELFARTLGARRVHFLPASGIPQSFIGQPQAAPCERSPGPFRMIWVGSLYPWKTCLLALEVVAEVTRRMPAELTIVGDGPQRKLLEAAVVRLGVEDHVRWTGWVPWQDMPSHYAGHHVLLFTSLRESCGMQILEGMAQGLPVVALDHHGARLLVTGDSGIKVPVTLPHATVRAMADAICRLQGDPAMLAAMSRAAIRVARQHTWPRKIVEALRLMETVPELGPAAGPSGAWRAGTPAGSRGHRIPARAAGKSHA